VNALTVDPATGFLQSPSPTNTYTFSGERKQKFIDLARSCAEAGNWPHIPKLCKAIGISVMTFYNHVNGDTDFKAQWNEVKRTLEGTIAADMLEFAKRPANYMDRVTLLRHLYPAEWGGEEPKINMNLDFGWLKMSFEGFRSTAIDAEVVPNKSDNQADSGSKGQINGPK
jgi:hypothetical protein